ncbi:MAG: hypothetical protein ABR518_03420, partial [Actinomycetota bacterium]
CGQIYVRDLRTGRTAMVSISSSGEPGDAPSGLGENTLGRGAVLSADGRFVAFTSNAANLVPRDTNVCPAFVPTYPAVRPGTCPDVFVHDRDADGDGIFDEDPRLEPGAVSTTRVSVPSDADQGDGSSDSPSISADGRYVAFASRAGNLVPGDNRMCKLRDTADSPVALYNCVDVFVHDRATGRTFPVSVSSTGRWGNRDSGGLPYRLLGVGLAISGDGRHVAFVSEASNLVPRDRNDRRDVFVHSLRDGRTIRVSTSASGQDARGHSAGPAISADGRYVAFYSSASDLVRGDRNGASDVFVHDRDTDGDGRYDEERATSTAVASLSSTGRLGSKGSGYPSISSDGRHIAFLSASPNLVPGDTNGSADRTNVGVDVFVRDIARGITIRISISSKGEEARLGGAVQPSTPSVSASGTLLAWDAAASDLTDDEDYAGIDVFVHRLIWR